MRQTRDWLIVRERAPLNLEPEPAAVCDAFITPVERFYVRCHGSVPNIDVAAHRLAVTGSVERPLLLSMSDLGRLPVHHRDATLCCRGYRGTLPRPGRAMVGNASWRGILLRDLLDLAGLAAGARHIELVGADSLPHSHASFAAVLSVDAAMNGDALLAWSMNGWPLTPEHGHPLRAIVPGFVGAASVKWLTAIRVLDRRPEAALKAGALATTAAVCERIDGGALRGYALAGPGLTIDRVELSADGGKTWRAAVLDDPAQPGAWRRWRHEPRPSEARAELQVRAIDDAGGASPIVWT